MIRKLKRALRTGLVFKYIVLILVAFIMLAPLLWMLTSSAKNLEQFYANPPVWIPIPAHFENYREALVTMKFVRTIGNSLFYAVTLAIVTVFSSSFVAFGFSRFQFKGKNIIFAILLATMMLPNQIMTIPMFITYRNLGWLNTFAPLIVPNCFGTAYHVFLIRQFMNGISKEVDEAAMLDGCGPFRLFFQMIMPLSKSVLAVSAIFNFLWAWKDVWYSSIYLQSTEMQTVSVRLLQFIGDKSVEYGQLIAATVMAIAPLVVLYLLCQKYFDSGINIAESK